MIGQGSASAVAAKAAWKWLLKEGGSQVAQELMIAGAAMLLRLVF